MSTLQRGREVYRPGLCPAPQLLTDPDASFKLPPCPTRQSKPHPQQPSDDGTSASQHGHLHSKPYLTQNPHPESRGKEQSCWGERRWGGLATGTGSLQSTLANPTTNLLRARIPRFPHPLQAASTASYSCHPAPQALPWHVHQQGLSVTSLLSPFTRKKVPRSLEACLHVPHFAPRSGDHPETHLI